MPGRVLIVEDEELQARALAGLLAHEGHEVATCHSGAEVLAQLARTDGAPGYELILADLRLPDMDGLELFRRVRERHGEDASTFVIMTAYGTVQMARDALKTGVYDFITKPVDSTELSVLVKNVLDKRRLRRENSELRRAVGTTSIEERLIGQSRAFRDMLELARAAAGSDATILIRGESGTGKELVAELIHAASPRADGPFVKVSCAAIPEALLESELFGHEQGAFTDARKTRKGRFELAGGGTIFLDEIGELSHGLQVKLLRVLQEHEVERLGGQGRVIPLDIRLVAATNRDLEAMVAKGTFREDLYYRINVITITAPPLRDRPGDVDLLANFFCRRFSHKNKKAFRGVSADALERLRRHTWPGNVRELENVIERAVVLGHGEWILPQHLPSFEDGARVARGPGRGDDLFDRVLEAGLSLDELERDVIRSALARAHGNVSEAARTLGLTRRTLQYRMGKHDIGRSSTIEA